MEKVIIVGNVYIEDNIADFLKEEGVLQEFIEESNRLNDWDGENDVSIDDISEAFFWDESEKGHGFWSKLSAKYFSNNQF
jgi:hypothetical protein